MEWILVIYVYAGIMSKGDSVTLTNVPGFKSQSECIKAGNDSKALVANSYKEQRFVCLSQSK